MDKIINNILEEWSYRVHDGMPNAKNPLHLIHLEETLNELNLPQKVAQKLLQNLRGIQEADAEVMGATVAQARDKAKDGQTYSSKRAKKVYKKGDEEKAEVENKSEKDKSLREDANPTEDFNNKDDFTKTGISDDEFENNPNVEKNSEKD